MRDKRQEERIEIPIESEEDLNDQSQNDEEAEAGGSEEKGENEKHDYLDQLQRLQAEFANYRKRTEKEWSMVFTRAKADMAAKLLQVLDDFDRLTNHHELDETAPMEGVLLIQQKMKKILQDEGVEMIEALDKPFDPEIHEAVSVEETDEDKDDMVVAEWQKGYKIGDILLRPSRVKVGRCLK